MTRAEFANFVHVQVLSLEQHVAGNEPHGERAVSLFWPP